MSFLWHLSVKVWRPAIPIHFRKLWQTSPSPLSPLSLLVCGCHSADWKPELQALRPYTAPNKRWGISRQDWSKSKIESKIQTVIFLLLLLGTFQDHDILISGQLGLLNKVEQIKISVLISSHVGIWTAVLPLKFLLLLFLIISYVRSLL